MRVKCPFLERSPWNNCKITSWPIALLLKLCSAHQHQWYQLSVCYNCRNSEPTVDILNQNLHLNLTNTNIHCILTSSLLDFVFQKIGGQWLYVSSQSVFCLGHTPKKYTLILKHLFMHELTELLESEPVVTNTNHLCRLVEKGTILLTILVAMISMMWSFITFPGNLKCTSPVCSSDGQAKGHLHSV